MVDPEVGGGTIVSEVLRIVQAARAIMRGEVENADNEQKRNNLAQRVRDEIKDSKLAAEEAVRNNKKFRGQLPPGPGAMQALEVLTRATAAAASGIKVSETTEGQILLVRLAETTLTPQIAAAIEAKISEYLRGTKRMYDEASGQITEDFKNDFESLKDADSFAANLVSESLINAARNSEIPNLSEDEAKRKLSASKPKEERAEMDTTERKQFEDATSKIRKAMNDAFERNKTLPRNDPNIFNSDERSLIQRFLAGDETLDRGRLREIFRKLGVSEEEGETYRRLYKKHDISEEPDSVKGIWLTDPQFRVNIDRALVDFNPEELRKKYLTNPDGSRKLSMTKEDRLKLKKEITKYYNMALEKIHQNNSQLYERSMQNNQQFAYYFSSLSGIVRRSCDNLREDFKDNRDMYEFLSDAGGRFQSSILTYAETFHNLPLYAKDAGSFEKWPEFLGYLFPSELAEVFDEGDRFIQMVRDEATMYIRKKIVLNGNQFPSDLVSGTYNEPQAFYNLNLQNGIENIMRKRVKDLGLDIDDWEFKRAITYSVGIGLANLVDLEVMTTADANPTFKGIHPLMGALSAKHNWTVGRGNPFAGRGPSKHILAMEPTLFPEQRGFFSRLFFKKKWIPAKFHEMVEEQANKYGNEILHQTFDRSGSYQELLNMVNIGTSLLSRDGWRMQSIRDSLKSLYKTKYGKDLGQDSWRDWTAKDWWRFFDLALRDYGNATLWYLIGSERIDNEMRRLLVDYFRGNVHKAQKEFEKYNNGEKALEKDIEFQIGNRKERRTYLEIKNLRIFQLRGETFYHYLRRNPGDFYLLLSQLVPQMVEGNLKEEHMEYKLADIFKTKEELEEQYIHDPERPPQDRRHNGGKKTELEVERILGKREQVLKRWGEEEFDTLKKINQWLIENTEKYRDRLVQEATTDAEKEKARDFSTKDFISLLTEESGTAYERMMNENNPKKNPDDRRPYLVRDDFKNAILAEAIFGTNGLYKIVTKEDFANLDRGEFGFSEKFGDYNRVEPNFFFRMGESWTLRQADINPFPSDFDHYKVYKVLGEVGEDVARRWLGDAGAVKKMIEGVAKLDETLLHASNDGNFEHIYELHEQMFVTLKNIISDEYAQRANYILASIVSQFFFDDSRERNVLARFGLINYPIRWLLGGNIALSKIINHGNRHAYSMDENAVREYFRHLAYVSHVIPSTGAWSIEQLESCFDSNSDVFFWGNIGPGFGWFIFLFLLYTYIKKATEEAEGKKH